MMACARPCYLHRAPDADKVVIFLHDPAITYVAGLAL
jgi:hypothetical protein